MKDTQISMYIDGACSGNPGPGGYAAIILYGPPNEPSFQDTIVGGKRHTTNNRMEFTALLEGLKIITHSCTVAVFTDSRLVIGLLSGGWKRKNLQLQKLCSDIEKVIEDRGLSVDFTYVPGHSGNRYNEEADYLAVAQRDIYIKGTK